MANIRGGNSNLSCTRCFIRTTDFRRPVMPENETELRENSNMTDLYERAKAKLTVDDKKTFCKEKSLFPVKV